MVILHIACIDEDKTNGVCVTVPQHLRAQNQFAETALINVSNVPIPQVDRQFTFKKPFDLAALPEPFNCADIVVFHECYRPAYLAIAKQLRKQNIPYVIVPHGELRREAQKKKHVKKALANFLLFNSFIDHAAALQCLSESELKATHFGKKKFVGTNGVEFGDRVKTSFRTEGTAFLYIGRYEWRVKGLDLLFDAIKMKERFLRENHCRFSLYGPDIYGRFDAVFAMVQERQIGDLVSMHHEILGDDKRAALLDADIFIQTSRHEGMPMGILEAMSYGLPCLVTEGTSLGETIAEENAGWTSETSAQGIAENLVAAVRDRKRWADLGCNGRRCIEDRYAWNSVASQTVDIYKCLRAELAKE